MNTSTIAMCFLIIYIIEAIIQIKSLNNLKKNNLEKFYNIFIGLNISTFICIFINYLHFLNISIGLGEALEGVLICALIFIVNILLTIIGTIKNKKYKNKIKLKYFLKTLMIILTINTATTFIVPNIVNDINHSKTEKFVLSYLENKYGDNDFEIIKMEEEYSYDGIINKYLTGFSYTVKSNKTKDSFCVSVNNHITTIEKDYFLPLYYSEKYNLKYKSNNNFYEFEEYIAKTINYDKFKAYNIFSNYVNSINNNQIIYNDNYYIIPENYGKIPSMEEFIELLDEYYKTNKKQ